MRAPAFPVDEWVTIRQAVQDAHKEGQSLEEEDLRQQCRRRFAPLGLAVFIGRGGINTGGSAQDYVGLGGRGIWLIHRDAVRIRLQERIASVTDPNYRRRGRPFKHPATMLATSQPDEVEENG